MNYCTDVFVFNVVETVTVVLRELLTQKQFVFIAKKARQMAPRFDKKNRIEIETKMPFQYFTIVSPKKGVSLPIEFYR